MIENKGNLWFYDSGMKFLGEKHALKNLTRENDICVYSLTPGGEKQPKYLIAKVVAAGALEKQLDGTAKGAQCCVVMEIMDYEKMHPMNLFSLTNALVGTVGYNVKHYGEPGCVGEPEFFRKNGNFTSRLTAQEFFSIEVDPASDEPGAKIYLQDKANFFGISK